MSIVTAKALPVKPATAKPVPSKPATSRPLTAGEILKLPQDQQQDAYLASLPSDKAREQYKFRRKRLNAYAKCSFNKRVQRLIMMLAKVQVELEEMAGFDEWYAITQAWAKAGVPFDMDAAADDEQGDAERSLDLASHVRQAAGGAAWAVECYLSQLDGMVVDRPRRSRR